MNTDSMLKEIINYINNDRLNYALLINGQWGTGKTFFIKNKLFPLLLTDIPKAYFIKNIKNKLQKKIFKNNKKEIKQIPKKPIYISLYGVESVDDISTQIYFQLSGKLSRFLSLGTGLVKAFKTDINISEILKTINDKLSLENYILVFDDLERINMDINTCLSYINSFVEHQNIKTIIIANENELSKMNFDNNYELKVISSMFDNINYEDPKEKNLLGEEKSEFNPSLNTIKHRLNRIYNGNNRYKKIKEKLIGDTINYIPDMNEVVENLIKEYKEEDIYKNFLVDHKDILLSSLDTYNCMNIRTVKRILEGFYSLFECINSLNIKAKKTILKRVYINYIVYIINIKNGKNKLKWEAGENYNEAASFEESDRFELSKFFVAFRFIDDYIFCKEINKNQIENVLKDYIENNETETLDASLSYNKLKEYWLLEDKEIATMLKKLLKEIDMDKYQIRIFPKIILTLSYIENLNYETEIINKIIDKMKNKIIERKYKFSFFDLEAHFVNDEKIKKIYSNHIKSITKDIIKDEKEKYLSDIDYIFECSDWGNKLYTFVCDKNNYNKILNSKEFMSRFNMNKLASLINKSDSKNLYYFKYSLDRIYNFSNIKDYYEGDRDNIIKLNSLIGELETENYGVTKKEALNYIKEELTKISDLFNS